MQAQCGSFDDSYIGYWDAFSHNAVPLYVLIFGNLGIALCAGAAAAVNHVVDRHIDEKMARTANRPIAKGRLSPNQAIIFALLIGLLGIVVLVLFTNVLTAWLTLASLIGYAFIYTMYLKRATPQNIVIGGWRGSAAFGLGSSDGRNPLQRTIVGFDYLCLDTAALLGAGTSSQRRIRESRYTYVASDTRRYLHQN